MYDTSTAQGLQLNLAGAHWLMSEAALEKLAVFASRLDAFPSGRIAARARDPNAPAPALSGAEEQILVVPVRGPIFPRANFLTDFLAEGCTVLDELCARLVDADDDPRVTGIVLDVDSPGGMITGLVEATAAIRRLRTPVHAHVSGTALEGAYWLASAARSVSTSNIGLVGGIGVVLSLRVPSKREADRTVQVVSSQSPNKAPDPRSDAGRETFTKLADSLTGAFINQVAEFRGRTADQVRAQFGAGGIVQGEQALEAGMVDQVTTLHEVVAELAAGKALPGPGRRQMEAAPTAAAAAPATAVTASPGQGDNVHRIAARRPASAATRPPAAPVAPVAAPAPMTEEQRQAAAWRADAALRAEFGGRFEWSRHGAEGRRRAAYSDPSRARPP